MRFRLFFFVLPMPTSIRKMCFRCPLGIRKMCFRCPLGIRMICFSCPPRLLHDVLQLPTSNWHEQPRCFVSNFRRFVSSSMRLNLTLERSERCDYYHIAEFRLDGVISACLKRFVEFLIFSFQTMSRLCELHFSF